MSYLYLYIIGVFISAIVAGLLTRNVHLKDDDYVAIIWAIILWPLALAVLAIATPFAIAFGLPWAVFAFVRGDLNEPIEDAIKWFKTTWNNIGD